ncbi:MAG: 4Fe-4S binding protein [Candidatus Izemoplasmatales bacterium]|jgi:MinD superfamily P-loop ATPase
MKIAVLSGKGGTGKTLCAVNLTAVSPGSIYVDCDIEEPDGHLFFKPKTIQSEKVTVFFPKINALLCNGCRQCVDFCRFNALAMVHNCITVFPEVCHACGGCAIICPVLAISDGKLEIGVIDDGTVSAIRIISGTLNPGRESGVPIINKMAKMIENTQDLVFIDCPPGSSCATVESIRIADFCILVTEPTRFGAHDLEMVHELIISENKPCAAILNKIDSSDDPSETYCIEKGIPIMGKIPYDPELGRINSEGLVAAWEKESYKIQFAKILSRIIEEASHETVANPKR